MWSTCTKQDGGEEHIQPVLVVVGGFRLLRLRDKRARWGGFYLRLSGWNMWEYWGRQVAEYI
jgi:hypothetical protein